MDHSQRDDEGVLLGEPDPEQAWAVLLESFLPTIERAAFRVTRDEEDARTVAAEILTRFRATWPALLERYRDARSRANGSFRVWLAIVARNAAVDVVRSIRGREVEPRPVARLDSWKRRLWRLVFVERQSPTLAAETLRAEGEWGGSLESVAEALDEIRSVLPVAERAASPRRAQPGAVADPAAPDRDEPRSLAVRRAIHDTLREILREFSADERLLIRLYCLEGLRASQVADSLQIDGADRVYERFRKLLVKLRRCAEERKLDVSDIDALDDFDWWSAIGSGDPGGPS